MPTLACPSCASPLSIPESTYGVFTCPKCKGTIAVPKPVETAPLRKPESRGGKICSILSFVFGALSLIACAPICGLVGVAPLFGLAGVVLGVVGLVLSRDKVPAIVAVSLSVVATLCGLIVWAVYINSRP